MVLQRRCAPELWPKEFASLTTWLMTTSLMTTDAPRHPWTIGGHLHACVVLQAYHACEMVAFRIKPTVLASLRIAAAPEKHRLQWRHNAFLFINLIACIRTACWVWLIAVNLYQNKVTSVPSAHRRRLLAGCKAQQPPPFRYKIDSPRI